jgi:hypothetical protein
MRHVVAMLAILTAGGLYRAFADPPVTPAASESQSSASQSSTAAQGNGQNTAAQTPPAKAAVTGAQTAAVATANPAPSASSEQTLDKQLLAKGYTPRVIRGEKVYCKRETATGSNLPELRCMSVESAEEMAKEGRDLTERIQHNTYGCLLTGSKAGTCGN